MGTKVCYAAFNQWIHKFPSQVCWRSDFLLETNSWEEVKETKRSCLPILGAVHCRKERILDQSNNINPQKTMHNSS